MKFAKYERLKKLTFSKCHAISQTAEVKVKAEEVFNEAEEEKIKLDLFVLREMSAF